MRGRGPQPDRGREENRKNIIFEMQGKVEVVRDPTLQTFIIVMGGSPSGSNRPHPLRIQVLSDQFARAQCLCRSWWHDLGTTGLLVLAESEHEIAGCSANEISHVTARTYCADHREIETTQPCHPGCGPSGGSCGSWGGMLLRQLLHLRWQPQKPLL